MSKQTKLNFFASLQLLAMIFAIFFVMAFACDSGGDNSQVSDNEGDNPQAEDFTYQIGVGKKYAMRDPRTCARDTKAPTTGAITAVLARKYFMCQIERESSELLYLVEDVKVEVGGGIPYRAIMGHRSFHEIDVNHPVYPIRGSYTSYQCRRVYDENEKPYCNVKNVKADGYCYKTTFGDWQCRY